MASEKQKTDIDEQIDKNLRRVYEQTSTEELPDKFLDLIAKLKAGEEVPQDDK